MHAEIERHLERSGVAWTHLRPSQFMPEYLRELPTIVHQSALFLPLEDAKLAPVDMEDIAKAAFARPTTFAEFARRNAASLRGEVTP